jgi:peptide deformylase
MTRAILAYGHSILQQPCEDIDRHYPDLDKLIPDMWDTMERANGCGLAAPQIGLPIRLFIVDSKTTFEYLDEEERKHYYSAEDEGIRETFINARITERSTEEWIDEEGCLSIPGVLQPVQRPWSVTVSYYNAEFELHTKIFSGLTARMIQHEYDHTEGVLFLDYLNPLKRKLLEGKLKKVQKGQIYSRYPMRFVR